MRERGSRILLCGAAEAAPGASTMTVAGIV